MSDLPRQAQHNRALLSRHGIGHNSTGGPTVMWIRSEEEIRSMFGPLRLLEPGLVRIPLWCPESPHDVRRHVVEYPGCAGVGCRP
jgi:hypothetical protein